MNTSQKETSPRGLSIIGNTFEKFGSISSATAIVITGDGATVFPMTNLTELMSTVVGNRSNMQYLDGPTEVFKTGISSHSLHEQ
ncbi:hypothetical protein [Roseibium album]|uniref:Uncharacterized protein n=1 Tax=Roseibium album TaxID=311410 RepID=A0A0M6ZC26_9HYPH|nr:hypothetical protein [Roseibium album]CTQ59791.1 hypothetical protein LA5094_02560 [Roseibium album]CTQ76302.1 hypothetical protein LA5095_03616 [Roseibium album]CTQ76827.1 hypothetical protein LA5096_04898 [Roseibium album]